MIATNRFCSRVVRVSKVHNFVINEDTQYMRHVFALRKEVCYIFAVIRQ